jgi:hypothetical protein
VRREEEKMRWKGGEERGEVLSVVKNLEKYFIS